MMWTHRALGWSTAGKVCATTPLQSNTASCLGFEVCNAERAQASAGALQAVHATGSGGLHTQHDIHCTSHLPYNRQVAPATTGPGALTGAGHYAEWKDTRSSGNTHLRNV